MAGLPSPGMSGHCPHFPEGFCSWGSMCPRLSVLPVPISAVWPHGPAPGCCWRAEQVWEWVRAGAAGTVNGAGTAKQALGNGRSCPRLPGQPCCSPSAS